MSELTRRYVLPKFHWRDVMRIAKVRDPEHLPVRRVLLLPRSWLRWKPEEASFASVRGEVTVVVQGRRLKPVAGTALSEGVEIFTGANSFTTLVLSNGSRIALPSQSRVAVTRLRKFVINGAIDYELRLEQGRVDTRATPLKDPSGRFRINTPLAMTAVRGTEFDVGFDSARRETATEVFEGTVAVSGVDTMSSVLVPERYGAVTDSSGQSLKVELIDAPELQNPGRIQTDDLVTFDLEPVPGAIGYRLVLASDAGFVDRYREQDEPSPRFSVSDVPNGNQFVRISAIAENGLEGLRQSYSFIRKLASIQAEAAATPDGYRFKWFGSGTGERRYRLQIFRNTVESVPVVDEVGLTQSEAIIRNLSAGTYFWRVAVAQIEPDGEFENWTQPEKLIVAEPDGD